MECLCERTKEFRIGSNEFFIRNRKITIHNIPHFFCPHCNKDSYDSKLPVDDALKYAYKNNLNELSWEEYKAYAFAYERAFEIDVLMVVRRMLDSGIKIDEVARHTDYSPEELGRLLQDRDDLIKERMRIRGYAFAFEKEWHRQESEVKEQTLYSRLRNINARIKEFELQYGDTYDNLFGHISDIEIDENVEAVNIFDWRDLEEEKARIALALEDDFPDGVFAIPSTSKVKVRPLSDYCKETGKIPSELSAREIEQFIED